MASHLRRLAVAWLGVALTLAGLACSPAAGPRPWKLTWSDTFAGPAGGSIDLRKWKYETGRGIFGTGEVETMTSSRYNVRLDGRGNLELVVLGHGAAGAPDAAWTSGRIRTRSSRFAAPAGGELLVTASIRQPAPAHGLGYWPGFWMLGRDGWPAGGEIDVMESVNALSTDSGALHCGNLTQPNRDGTFGPCHEKSGLGSGLRACPGCQQGFHVYSAVIDRRQPGREQIRWYLDGREFFHLNEGQVGRAAWAAGVDHGFSILFSLAAGGAFPDSQCRCPTPTSQTSTGGTMAVRYVKVYTS